MKYQFILRHFILWAAWCFLLMGIAGAQPQSTGQSQAKAINHVPDPLEGLEEPWKTMPISELLKAAESGNAHAQYAYWIREFLLAWEEPDRLSAVVSSNVYRLPFKEQMKLVDEQNRTRGKWEAATEAELQQAAQSGDNMAMQFLAIRKAGQAVQRSTNAFAWLEKSAEQGFPAAEFEASMYYLGQSGRNIIKINQEKGMGLLQRAAVHGLAAAQYTLGLNYLDGQLVPPDLAKAVENFRMAADQGGPRSQYTLARLYANGIGNPRDSEDSPFALLLKSAKSNYPPALHALAERYRTGMGVSMDYVQAIRYYKAERQAEEEAPRNPADNFGLLDENLQPQPVLEPDFAGFAGVLSAYLKATERGDATAMSQLGDWYQSGRFMPKNSVEAFRWYDQAANGGLGGAAVKRDRLKPLLTPDERTQALKP